MMNPNLQQLKDIHLPHAFNKLWPLAPGWIILCILVLMSFCGFLYVYYRKRRKKQIVRFILKKLYALEQLSLENTKGVNIAAEVASLLRRTALHYFPREQIAGISGKAWLDFLNQSGQTTKFTQDVGLLLVDIPYRKNYTSDLSPLFALAKVWVLSVSKTSTVVREK
jgi:hypothetical protein